MIGFDPHRLVEPCNRFAVPTGHGKRLRVARDIADVAGEKLMGPAHELELLLRRTRPLRERQVILRGALPHFERVAFERRPVERAFSRFQHRALQKPDFSEKAGDRMAAVGQPDVADLEPVAIEFDMARVAIRRVIEDISRRDEALQGEAALDLVIEPARVGFPAVLEGNETRIDRELRR